MGLHENKIALVKSVASVHASLAYSLNNEWFSIMKPLLDWIDPVVKNNENYSDAALGIKWIEKYYHNGIDFFSQWT